MDKGICTLATSHPVDEVVRRFTSVLSQKGIKLFAVVDHSGEASAAGFWMPNTKLLIFGNPRAGTPLMISSPSTALDLPLKLLVSQQPDGSSTILWNDPAWLQQRHEVRAEFLPVLSAVEGLVRAALAEEAAEPAGAR